MRSRIIAVGVAFTLVFSAGIASANDDETGPEGDTIFSYGYDAESQLFYFGANAADSSPVEMSEVTVGTEGPINHGQFMKTINENFDMTGRGCLNRWVAQSDLGKGDQGTIDLTTIQATCEHGKKDKGEDHPGRGHHKDEAGADQGNGRPDAPGKSDQAPGRNKDK